MCRRRSCIEWWRTGLVGVQRPGLGVVDGMAAAAIIALCGAALLVCWRHLRPAAVAAQLTLYFSCNLVANLTPSMPGKSCNRPPGHHLFRQSRRSWIVPLGEPSRQGKPRLCGGDVARHGPQGLLAGAGRLAWRRRLRGWPRSATPGQLRQRWLADLHEVSRFF